MQKLVTIYLDNMAYAKSKMIVGFGDRHTSTEEHLKTYLADGWRILSVTPMGSTEGVAVRGWLAVVLEKNDH